MNLENIGLPNQYLKASATKILNLSVDQIKKLEEWASQPYGNCILYGKAGRGKTYCAAALMNYFRARGMISVCDQRFINISSLYQRWLANMNNYSINFHYANTIKECKLLVVDDLGVKKPTDSFLDYIYDIINERGNNPELLTIYTTNLCSKEIMEYMGPRVCSRIMHGQIFIFEGEDLRLLFKDSQKIEVLYA